MFRNFCEGVLEGFMQSCGGGSLEDMVLWIPETGGGSTGAYEIKT